MSLKHVAEAAVASRFKQEVAQTKFRNVKVEIDGIKFASKAEGHRYTELKLMEKAGLIRHLRLQVPHPLVVNEVKICTYIADFCYMEKVPFASGESWQPVVEDVKGVRTPAYRLKKKLCFAILGITIRETR
jgi:hypothetical protein